MEKPLLCSPVLGKEHAKKYDETDPEFAKFTRINYGNVWMNQETFYDMVRKPFEEKHRNKDKIDTNTKEHIGIFLSKSPEEMKKILTSNNIFDIKDVYEFLSIKYAGTDRIKSQFDKLNTAYESGYVLKVWNDFSIVNQTTKFIYNSTEFYCYCIKIRHYMYDFYDGGFVIPLDYIVVLRKYLTFEYYTKSEMFGFLSDVSNCMLVDCQKRLFIKNFETLINKIKKELDGYRFYHKQKIVYENLFATNMSNLKQEIKEKFDVDIDE